MPMQIVISVDFTIFIRGCLHTDKNFTMNKPINNYSDNSCSLNKLIYINVNS